MRIRIVDCDYLFMVHHGIRYKPVILAFFLLLTFTVSGQEKEPKEKNVQKELKQAEETAKRDVIRDYRESKGITYDLSWAFTFKYRTDGWQLGADYNKTINYFKSRVLQIEIGEYKHFKQERQSKDPSGGIFGFNGIRPFVYGKQNNLFVIHGKYGRRHLLAERAKKNGVMIQFQYTGGISLGLLKAYYLEVYPEEDGVIQFDQAPVSTKYEEGVDNGFTEYNRILGYSGFGKGFGDIKFQPGVTGQVAFQFDWSNQDSFIKALEAGFSADIYFWEVPIMISQNRFYFLNVYIGILLGKKKN